MVAVVINIHVQTDLIIDNVVFSDLDAHFVLIGQAAMLTVQCQVFRGSVVSAVTTEIQTPIDKVDTGRMLMLKG